MTGPNEEADKSSKRSRGRAASDRAYYLSNRSKILERSKKWAEKNADQRAVYIRSHYLNNRDKYLEKSKAWRLANPEKVRASVERRNRSPGARACRSKWKSLHAVSYKASEKIRAKKRVATRMRDDPAFAAKATLRTRVNAALRGFRKRWGGSTTKTGRTVDLIGCSYADLVRHLESKFAPGMNWENRGRAGWHIDHIRPCSSFDLSDPEQQRACFHFSNLQPLWAEDNLRKADKWEEAA